MSAIFITLSEIRPDDLVLTPNQRSARIWAELLAGEALRTHAAAVMPAISPTTAWLVALWSEAQICAAGMSRARADLPRLLSATQERALWGKVIAEHPDSPPMAAPNSLVTEAMRAWRLDQAWDCPKPFLDSDDAAEVNLYALWRGQFWKTLGANRWLTAAQLPRALLSQIEQLRIPKRIVRLPSVQTEPALAALLAAFALRGTQIVGLQYGHLAVADYQKFERPAQEWRAAAAWAKSINAQNPDARIVVVVPQLHAVRHEVQRAFREILAPHVARDAFAEAGAQFNLSLGIRLSEAPFIAAMLDWLGWSQRGDDLATARAAMAAPFIPAAQNWVRNALQKGRTKFSLRDAAAQCAAGHPIHAFIAASGQWPKRCAASVWAAHFSAALAQLGAPGQLPDLAAQQAFAAWEEMLAGLAELDGMLGEISARAVLDELNQRCRAHDFQVEGKDAPIQVLGLYESIGFPCDAMWVSGMSDGALPEPAEANAFLPLAWQLRAHVGRATPHVMMAAAQSVWDQWHAAAPQLILSAAQAIDDAADEWLPVSFARNAAWRAGEIVPAAVIPAAQIEPIFDDLGVPFLAAALPGGATMLERQAQCPFQAYAAHRLQIEPWPAPMLGITAMERGNAIHIAMAALFGQCESYAQWQDAAPETQAQWLDLALAEARSAMEPFERSRRTRGWPQDYADGFFEQLRETLALWMEMIESLRAPYRVVARELPATLAVGGHTINVRLDRVDETAHGQQIIVDYKSGKPKSLTAMLDPAHASALPQLPIYALAHASAAVIAVAYAHVRAEAPSLVGVGDAAAEGLGKRLATLDADGWQHWLEQWRDALAETANNFARGQAGVVPRSPLACRDCQRQGLCRIDFQAHEAPIEEELNDASA